MGFVNFVTVKLDLEKIGTVESNGKTSPTPISFIFSAKGHLNATRT